MLRACSQGVPRGDSEGLTLCLAHGLHTGERPGGGRGPPIPKEVGVQIYLHIYIYIYICIHTYLSIHPSIYL